MGIRFERWLIKPLACPRPIRYCPTCGVAKEFICSERFRINAQKKTVDVWLHYRCSDCGGAWKLPVLERQSIDSLDAAAYEAFVRHDTSAVWKHAFDLGRMRAHVVDIDASVSVVVERTIVGGSTDVDGSTDAADLCIHLVVPFACDIRLDRLLATELQVSRANVERRHQQGELLISPDCSGALSKRARDGQQLLMVGWGKTKPLI
jgi:hypothetical protein